MTLAADSLPTDLAAAHAMIIAQHEALLAAQARASAAESEAQFRALLIEKIKYTIAKLRREKFESILGTESDPGATRTRARRSGRRCLAGGDRGAAGGGSGEDRSA